MVIPVAVSDSPEGVEGKLRRVHAHQNLRPHNSLFRQKVFLCQVQVLHALEFFPQNVFQILPHAGDDEGRPIGGGGGIDLDPQAQGPLEERFRVEYVLEQVGNSLVGVRKGIHSNIHRADTYLLSSKFVTRSNIVDGGHRDNTFPPLLRRGRHEDILESARQRT